MGNYYANGCYAEHQPGECIEQAKLFAQDSRRLYKMLGNFRGKLITTTEPNMDDQTWLTGSERARLHMSFRANLSEHTQFQDDNLDLR